ncbi:thiamine phosphate synthase [Thalassotalea fusca]
MAKPIVWTISGADCSGGAGIAADIKTLHTLGVEVCHVITANTVQNAKGLYAVNPVLIDVIRMQLYTLLEDKQPRTIKIGLIASDAQLLLLIDWLATLKRDNGDIQVVFDPVGQASVGGKFASLTPRYVQQFCALCDVVTPNLDEAHMLLALEQLEHADISAHALARELSKRWHNTVIVKGGHDEGENATDHAVCYGSGLYCGLSAPRIATSYSHGGGCVFASAIAAFLAQGYLFRDAFTMSKALIQQGLAQHQGQQGYYGAFAVKQWPAPSQFFPSVVCDVTCEYQALGAFPSLGLSKNEHSLEKLGLYPVVDSVSWLEQLLPANLNIIQLRLKNLSQEALKEQISQAIALCNGSNTRLFINDHWQLAIELGAYGVHLGQEDLADADLAAIHRAGLRLGISTHGCYEFLLAQQLQPSYLAIGAIFPTKTKDMTGQIQGVDNLRQILTLAKDIPIVAIGGINAERVSEVWQTGVDSIAVVTAITEAEQPLLAAKTLQQLLV